MRRFLLILATIVVIVLAAVAYVSMQTPPPQVAQKVQIPTTRSSLPLPSARSAGSTTSPTTQDSMPIVQTGEDVWVTVPDENGGIKWQFKASRYEPRPDNSVDVDHPHARFFLQDGRMVTLDGIRGRVIIPATTAHSTDIKSTVVAPPSRGNLYDVTISMYDTVDSETPTLVTKMNNVSFDNDTYRIETEKFTQPDGTVVPADEVPVQVRGKAYDFDGRGLTVQWNDRDGRLELLEIAHGESLTIKTLEESTPTTKPAPIAPPPRPVPPAPARGRGNARRGGPTTQQQRTGPPPATRNTEPPTYRATFYGGVRVTQVDQDGVDQTVAKSQTMQVDFKNDQQDDSSNRVSKPAPTPPPAAGRRGGRRGQVAPPPVRAPATARTPTTAPTTRPQNTLAKELFPTTSSTDKPAEPYVIHWPGKLIVVPLENPPNKLQPGQQVIEMFSGDEPVVLVRQGSEIHCASFLYNDANGDLVLHNSPKFDLISMQDVTGKILYTPSMVYSGTTQKAHLEGASHSVIPLDTGGVMKAQWSKTCDLLMIGDSPDKMTIQQADIVGDVIIDHPQLHMVCDSVHTEFVPTADPDKKQGVEPKHMIARGNVKCDMPQPDQTVQHIVCDTLELLTRPGPDGKITPDKVIADGAVHTFDDAQQQDLHTRELEITLAPTTQPGDPVRVQHLVARDDVQFASKDSTGSANRLEADMLNGDKDDTTLFLTGTEPLAQIKTGDSTLYGQDITIHQNQAKNEQSIHVRGPGKMNGAQQQSADQKPLPYELTWTKFLDFDGAANTGNVDGDVVVTTTSSDGTLDTITGNTLAIQLMDDPQAKQPTTDSSNVSAMMSKKAIRAMQLDGNCEVKSILNDDKGNLLRRVHLFSPKVNVDHVDNVDWQVIVPTAGQMLVDDRRPTTKPSTTQPTAGAGAASLGDMNGATAFQWDRQLIFDQAKNTADLLGNVRIVHQGNGQIGEPPRIEAQHVSAEFEKDPTAATTKPATTQPDDQNKMRLKMLTADGDVWFKADTIEFASQSMSFDPVSATLDARGDNGIPVQIYGKDSMSNGSWKEAIWNTRTQKVILQGGQSSVPR